MKILITLLTISSLYAQEKCSGDNHLEIKNTEFEEQILEHDPKLCFNKERLKGEPNLPYRERLKKSFDKLDELYTNDLEIIGSGGNPLTAFRKISPDLASTEILGLTRMDTKSDQVNGANRSWDYFALEGRGKKLRVRSPIHDFIGNSKHIDKEKLTEKVISDMDRYSQKFKCRYGAQVITLTRIRRLHKKDLASTSIKSKYKNSTEFKKSLAENKSEIEELFNKVYPKEEGIARNYNCSNEYDKTDNSRVYQGEDSCNIQVSHQFENNSAEITPDMLKGNPGYDKFIKCVNKKKLTQKLRDVSVTASSNSIRNSGDQYGKYDWKRLSDDRATNTAKAFQSILNPEVPFSKWKEKYLKTYTKGRNGDGTSGPCALEWKNNKLSYKPAYSSQSGIKSLAKFKSVSLVARFTQNTKTTNQKPTFYYQKRCREINYKCREHTTDDKSLAKRRRTIRQKEVFRSPGQF